MMPRRNSAPLGASMTREVFDDPLLPARTAEVVETLIALLLFKGHITPAEAEVVRNGGTRDFADIAQEPAEPMSGVPMEGA